MTYVCSVLAIDPGKVTGVALARIFEDQDPNVHPLLRGHRIEIVSHGVAEFTELRALAGYVQHAGTQESNLHIVVEKFIITRLTANTQASWSLEVIGMIRMLNALFPEPLPIDFTQKPSDIKSLIPTRVYRDLDLIPKDRKTTDHEIDAVRHIVLYANRATLGLVNLRDTAAR